jgi:hypothetical protein
METPITERRRIREVHKYCSRFQDAQIQANLQSEGQTVSSTKAASPNTNLTALMQLIAWRLGMQRAMVSVVDENEQVRFRILSYLDILPTPRKVFLSRIN